MVSNNLKPQKIWLCSVCISVVIILVVGGITRLTGSGLSMVDWRPIAGILPPITDAQWNEVFEMYQSSPEYQKVNKGMSLDNFKFIFFWEYLHRILGRIVGLLCLVPYLWFLFRGQLTAPLKMKGFFLILLVVGQGLMGWYMVKSGLVNNPEVSHYRLAAHLSLAFSVFGLAWWMLLDLDKTDTSEVANAARSFRPWVLGFLFLLCAQIAYGAFVSGMKAGYGFNTFPMMGEEWKPDALFGLTPYWKNFVEDKFSVQFIHRWMGTILTFGLIGLAWKAFKSGHLNRLQSRRMKWVVGLVSMQFILGVSTILLIVEYQVSLPVIHQLVALFLFAALLGLIHSLGFSPRKAIAS
jgi:cytochrome c oxidase assembly protein subunit 15